MLIHTKTKQLGSQQLKDFLCPNNNCLSFYGFIIILVCLFFQSCKATLQVLCDFLIVLHPFVWKILPLIVIQFSLLQVKNGTVRAEVVPKWCGDILFYLQTKCRCLSASLAASGACSCCLSECISETTWPPFLVKQSVQPRPAPLAC